MINLSRKNQPKYLFRLSVALVSFFAFWFTAVVAVMVAVGCIYGENVITYAVMGGGFGLFAIGLVIFFILDKTFYNRNILKLTAELEKEFTDMPFEEAERILKERGIITDTGFVVSNDGVFSEKLVSFEQAWLKVSCKLVSKLSIDVVLYDDNGEKACKYELDSALYNFLQGKETELTCNQFFNLLVNDKREFTKQALKRLSLI